MSDQFQLPKPFATWKEDDDDCGAWGRSDRTVFTAEQMRWAYKKGLEDARAQPAEEVQLMDHIMKYAVRGSTYQTVTSLNVLVDAQILEKHGRRAAIEAALAAKDKP